MTSSQNLVAILKSNGDQGQMLLYSENMIFGCKINFSYLLNGVDGQFLYSLE